MIPVAFQGRFGLLHEAPGDVAVILCGAIGFEQLCAQSGWRGFADQIAARGYPTLRFDWRGCGDSLGGDDDPNLCAAWEESLALALAFTREHLAPRRIVLIGLRFGATIAASFAARAGGVDGIALLGAAISGRLYGRELSALSRVIAQGHEAPQEDMQGAIDVAGFRMTRETLDAIQRYDLRKLEAAPAAHGLALAPAGQMGFADVVGHLRELGCETATGDFGGYADYLAEPTFSRPPEAVFSRTLNWLSERFPVASAPSRSPPPAARLDGGTFIETPALFGGAGKLFGMLCEPRGDARKPTAAIFVNAGANPHIGWARMHVDFARSLAAQGYTSLRMDAAGLGDSPPAPGRGAQVMYDEAPVADVSAAVDRLAGAGYKRIIVVGLCSGAHLAFHSAVANPRIDGVVMANLQRFVWRKDYSLAVVARQAYRSSGFYKQRAWRLDTYRRLWRGEIDARGIASELGRRSVRLLRSRSAALTRLKGEPQDDTSKVRRWFSQLGARGARLLLVYSAGDGGIDELFLHMGAGGKRLAHIPGAELAFIANADHNVTPRPARQKLLELITDFLDRDRVAQ